MDTELTLSLLQLSTVFLKLLGLHSCHHCSGFITFSVEGLERLTVTTFEREEVATLIGGTAEGGSDKTRAVVTGMES